MEDDDNNRLVQTLIFLNNLININQRLDVKGQNIRKKFLLTVKNRTLTLERIT